MRCPLCGGDFAQLTGHIHNPEGMKWWDCQSEDAKKKREREDRAPDATP